MDRAFNCLKCGECCRHIDLVPELSDFDRGDGVCKHLSGNLCSIYEHRPDICNVEVMYHKVYSKKYTKQEFLKINEEMCKRLISDCSYASNI